MRGTELAAFARENPPANERSHDRLVRQDLRLCDNSALHAAAARGGAVIPVYIWCPEEEGHWAPGAASKWWLHHSLHALDESLRARGSRLLLAIGPALEALRALAKSTSAGRSSGIVGTSLRRWRAARA